MTRRSDEELKQIAKDMHGNLIFTSAQIAQHEFQHMMGMVFAPIMFMEQKDREELAAKKPYVFYEYLNKALPRGVNGYPMFMSMGFLTKEEWDFVWEKYQKIEEAMNAL